MFLAFTLVVRGVLGVGFGAYFLHFGVASPTATFYQAGLYATADGLATLGCAMALTRNSADDWLGAMAGIDGFIRVSFGVLMLANPQIPDFLGISLVFLAALVVANLVMGTIELLYLLNFRRFKHPGVPVSAWPWAATTAALLTLSLGVCLAVAYPGAGTEERRWLFGVYALAMGLTMLTAAAKRTLGPSVRSNDPASFNVHQAKQP